MVVPPLNTGATQVILTFVASVVKASLATEAGASGYVTRMAPLPGVDSSELLTILVAVNLAKTLAPQTRLKGAACSVEKGIVHFAAAMITLLPPKQFTNSVL